MGGPRRVVGAAVAAVAVLGAQACGASEPRATVTTFASVAGGLTPTSTPTNTTVTGSAANAAAAEPVPTPAVVAPATTAPPGTSPAPSPAAEPVAVPPGLAATGTTTSLAGGAAPVVLGPDWRVRDGQVLIEAVASGDPGRMLADLTALGLNRADLVGRIANGWLPVEALAAAQGLASVHVVRPPAAAISAG